MKSLAIACVLAVGCGAEGPFAQPDAGGDGGTGDAANGCQVVIAFTPQMPVADPGSPVRAAANVVDAPGVLDYTWMVHQSGTAIPFTSAQPDNSAIEFIAPTPGTYNVSVSVTGSSNFCPDASVPLNVAAPGANDALVRLRVTPPHTSTVPPYERTLMIMGGANLDLGPVPIDPGLTANGTVVTGTQMPVAAFLRFSPTGTPDAIVETFTDGSGVYSTKLAGTLHNVLVIPNATTLAPIRLPGWTVGTSITVDGGHLVRGSVKDMLNNPVANAAVQLTMDGQVPSTIGTTDASGNFMLYATPGAVTTVEVTPPDTSGLPRLTATSTFDIVNQMLAIKYTSVTLRNLGGTHVRRNAAALANAKIVITGTMAAVGTVNTVNASGTVRIAATADATGALPSTPVPAAALSAVLTSPDLEVAALDTTTGVPATIDEPAQQTVTTALQDIVGTGLKGAVLDFVPVGALAMANAPVLHAVSGTNGALTATLAGGGHYDLRFRDPGARAAPATVTNKTSAQVVAAYHLPRSIVISGTAMVMGISTPLANASVQILCSQCVGIDRQKPIAETVSSGTGTFALAVPDPGTM